MKRVFGAFYGQVIGDALGVTCEFMNAEATTKRIQAVKDSARTESFIPTYMPMVGSTERGVKPGQVSSFLI